MLVRSCRLAVTLSLTLNLDLSIDHLLLKSVANPLDYILPHLGDHFTEVSN